ncbi:MAG TPA: hypothetical protein VKM55_06340 [Candidatus Lokiarchaeia archaeon]|nr:hypothetical protein [Candidatus Lokiarchaeia archaeon]
MSLTIDLEKQDYLPGETVKGNLTVVLDKAIKARKIEVKLEGKEYTAMKQESVQTRSTWDLTTPAIPRGTERESSTLQSESVIVDAAIDAWAASGVETLGPSTETYPFEFLLPANAIPSVASSLEYKIPERAAKKGIKHTIPFMLPGSIQYNVLAKIDVPRAIDPKAQAAVNVNLPPREDVVARVLGARLSIGKGNIHVEASVDKNVFTPGETITGNVMFRKNPSEKVRAVEIALKFAIMDMVQGQADTFEQACDLITFPITSNTNDFTSNFALESFPDGPFSVHGMLVKIMWFVDIKVDLARKIDKHARIPLHAIRLAENAATSMASETSDIEWIDVNVPVSGGPNARESIIGFEPLYKKYDV